jgi:putative hemolysin
MSAKEINPTMKRTLPFVLFLLSMLLLAACAGTPATAVTPTPGVGLPNPASQNCTAVGGTLQIETRADGGQFGVCTFEDNLQCEEWALLRGDCPAGGVKITGYITEAGRYCAITGGEYAVTPGDEQTEQGTCTFSNGITCDAAEYYNGVCSANE